ncbi:class I SAM-dependent methyltransferase [Candidatus Woesearchaeota archaeon]|nr:class I SAM-dependent methyltransferase [Candidatus Woesearchaeota archaeon]
MTAIPSAEACSSGVSAEQALINQWYSSHAGNYDALMNGRHELRHARETLMGLLDIREGYKVVEVSVGTGKNFPHYKKARAEVVGVDITSNMLDVAMRKARKLDLAGVVLMEGDGRRLPFRESSFDVGVLTYALSAIPDNLQALSETARVVRPGGRIGILDFYHSSKNVEGGVAGIGLLALVHQSGLQVVHNKSFINPRETRMPGRQGIYVLEVR